MFYILSFRKFCFRGVVMTSCYLTVREGQTNRRTNSKFIHISTVITYHTSTDYLINQNTELFHHTGEYI